MRRTKQEALETRSAILDAAELVFFEHGVARTSLSDIARAANVTRGAIYWHFRDKADVLVAMQRRVCLPQEEFFRSRESAEPARCLDVLHDTTIETIRRFADDRRAKRVYTIIVFRCEYVGSLRDILMKRCEADDRMKTMISDVFEAARRQGLLSPAWHPPIAAQAYLCTLVGLLSEWLRSEESFDILTIARPMMASLFTGFRAEASGPA